MRHNGKILIVDDNATNIAILEELLSDHYKLHSARSGEEALAALEEFRPDLILLDIMMPGIDGYETCRRIRANPAHKNVKVIMVSAKAMVSERLKGYEAGADDYITKPFGTDELLARLRAVFRSAAGCPYAARARFSTCHPYSQILDADLRNLELEAEMVKALSEPDKAILMGSGPADRLHQLFNKVLKLCTMKAGKWEFEFAKTDLSEIVTNATAEVAALASERDVKIEQELDQAIAEVDAKEIKCVVTALLDNAIRFSPSGGRVVVGVVADSKNLKLNVSDQGDGIDPDFLDRVFEEFNDSDVTHHTKGQRLSLAIARQVAMAHAGTINVKSEKGSGTTFTVQLPMVER